MYLSYTSAIPSEDFDSAVVDSLFFMIGDEHIPFITNIILFYLFVLSTVTVIITTTDSKIYRSSDGKTFSHFVPLL